LEPLPPDALRLVEATGNRVVVAGIPLRFDVPFPGWEAHERPYVSKSDHGPQGAEAIVFWTALPWSESASPCERLTDASSRPTPMALADAIAGAPLTDVVAAPRRTTFDGFPAVTVVVRVKIPLACDPGFFVAWHPYPGGALWPNVAAGDTYRAWVVDVDGALLLVGLGTRADAGEEVAREAGEIVRSMRLADVTTT
jgi:hypothetical protein